MKIIKKFKNWFNMAMRIYILQQTLEEREWRLSEAKKSRYRKASRNSDMLKIVEQLAHNLRCKKNGQEDCIHGDLPSDQSITAMQWNTHIEETLNELQKVIDAGCPYTNRVEGTTK